MNDRNILLTGATGFLGGAVLARLLAADCVPLMLVRAPTPREAVERTRASARQSAFPSAGSAASGPGTFSAATSPQRSPRWTMSASMRSPA